MQWVFRHPVHLRYHKTHYALRFAGLHSSFFFFFFFFFFCTPLPLPRDRPVEAYKAHNKTKERGREGG